MGSQHDDSQGLGQDFTQGVIDSMGPEAPPRLREILTSFIQHMHDFAREVQLTTDEMLMGVAAMNAAGQMSDEKRNEGQLFTDIIGLETLVDDITHRAAAKDGLPITNSAVLGPFWRADTPFRPNGSSISFDTPDDAEPTLMHGVVRCAETRKPLAKAVVDVWQCSTNGLYEQQDPKQREWNLRGKFETDEEGRYSFYCIRPVPYPVPIDGPSGKLLLTLGRQIYRPAHIHLIVEAEGYNSVTTQVYDSSSEYIDNDVVWAVKNDLLLDFKPRKGDPNASLEVDYDILLAPKST